MELNASDERGISVVREKIKNFATYSVANYVDGNFSPPYKLLILDEADSMTPEAQHAMRRIIESYSKVTRFCLICNYISRIIEPIVSRCAKFFFRQLPDFYISRRIMDISTRENVKLYANVAEKLGRVSKGDLRNAITILQTAVSLQKCMVTSNMISEVIDFIPKKTMKNIWSACKAGRFEDVHEAIKHVVLEGYPGQQIIYQLLETILMENNLCDIEFARISAQLGLTDKALIDGSHEYLQLLNLFQNILIILKRRVIKHDDTTFKIDF
jgi:replication factor C subunit 2/4